MWNDAVSHTSYIEFVFVTYTTNKLYLILCISIHRSSLCSDRQYCWALLNRKLREQFRSIIPLFFLRIVQGELTLPFKCMALASKGLIHSAWACIYYKVIIYMHMIEMTTRALDPLKWTGSVHNTYCTEHFNHTKWMCFYVYNTNNIHMHTQTHIMFIQSMNDHMQ